MTNTIEILKSQRGGELAIHNDYIYHFSFTSEDNTTWRCRINNCNARVKTNQTNIVIEYIAHNHDADMIKLARLKHRLQLKTLSTETRTPNADVFTEVISSNNTQHNYGNVPSRRSSMRLIQRT